MDVCPVCASTFTRRDNLLRHMKRHVEAPSMQSNNTNSRETSANESATQVPYKVFQDKIKNDSQTGSNGKRFNSARPVIENLKPYKRANKRNNSVSEDAENPFKYVKRCEEARNIKRHTENLKNDSNTYERRNEMSGRAGSNHSNYVEKDYKVNDHDGDDVDDYNGNIEEYNCDNNERDDDSDTDGDYYNSERNELHINGDEDHSYSGDGDHGYNDNEFTKEIFLWDDPNKLVNKLRTLALTREGRDAIRIIAELRKHDIIE